jgi:Family of unknown function (DUF5670)
VLTSLPLHVLNTSDELCKTEQTFGRAVPTMPASAVRSRDSLAEQKEMENMLGIIAAVLIVFWLLGFLAFHVAGAFIHLALVLGVVLLVVHFMRGRTATV